MQKPIKFSPEATIFRDAEYGALGVAYVAESKQVVVADHTFNVGDYAEALNALDSVARVVAEGESGTIWEFKQRAEVGRATLESALRARGYVADAYDPKSARTVSPEEALRPDLPVIDAPRATLHEVLERGLRARIEVVLSEVGPARFAAPSAIHFFPRPIMDSRGSPLPFVRARALVRGTDVDDTRRRLRRCSVVEREGAGKFLRASVESISPGVMAIEVGFAPSLGLCAGLMESAIPVFAPSRVVGSRAAHFLFNAIMTLEEAESFARRAIASTAAVRVIRRDERRLVVHVPAAHEGSSLSDEGFQERVTWVEEALGRWSPSLEEIDPVEVSMAVASEA